MQRISGQKAQPKYKQPLTEPIQTQQSMFHPQSVQERVARYEQQQQYMSQQLLTHFPVPGQQPNTQQSSTLFQSEHVQNPILKGLPFKNTSIACFNQPTDFIRKYSPKCESPTATIVNKTPPKYTDLQGYRFQQLRNQYGAIRYNLMAAKNQRSFAERLPNYIPSAIHDLDLQISQNREQYLNGGFKMQQNGILNCMEYADFALSFIEDEKLLTEGYTAHFATLNNPKIYESHPNHDHAFVVITNKANKNKIEFVVDLWLSQVNPHNTAFIGTVSDYINFINSNPDGRYVMKGGIKLEHIEIPKTGLTPLLQPGSDPIPGYDQGGNYASLNNSNDFLNDKYASFN